MRHDCLSSLLVDVDKQSEMVSSKEKKYFVLDWPGPNNEPTKERPLSHVLQYENPGQGLLNKLSPVLLLPLIN